MNKIKIFKIEYFWPEGEHEETLIGKDVDVEEFEMDLLKAKKFAESLMGKKVEGNYLGKGYSVECLPEFYEQILWYLTEKLGYVHCDYDEKVVYDVDDSSEGIEIRKYKTKTEVSKILPKKEEIVTGMH